MPKNFYKVNLNFSYPGWHQGQVSKALESYLKFFLLLLLLWGHSQHNWVSDLSNLPKFPSTLPGRDLKPTPLWMEADISTQSAQASIEKNTVPCIPAGPKSCLVRKMAWSWYSACSGSRRCCVLAHRHTCSKLRDGLPRSIRLIDCRRTKIGENITPRELWLQVTSHSQAQGIPLAKEISH